MSQANRKIRQSELQNYRISQESANPQTQRKISDLKKKLENEKAKNVGLDKDIKSGKKQEEVLTKQLNRLRQVSKGLRQKDVELKNDITALQQELSHYKSQLKTLKDNNRAQRAKQNQQKISIESASNNELKKLESKIKQKQFELSQRQKQLNKISGEKKGYQFQIQNRQSKLQTIKKRCLGAEQALKQQQSQFQILKQILNDVVEKQKSIVNELQSQKLLLNSEQKQIQRLNILLEQQRRNYSLAKQNHQAKQIIPPVQQSNAAYLFQGDVLYDRDDDKQFLLHVLEERTRRRIVFTKLIYRFDQLNKVNFHQYIDKNQQLVIIIKLTNDGILGAWTEGSFYPKMVSDKDGLIFSITNKKVFQLREKNRRAIAYDDFFLIIGNSEVRLKSQDKRVFSNFAISNSYYNNREEKVNSLMCSGTNREVELQTFEVFQLKFY